MSEWIGNAIRTLSVILELTNPHISYVLKMRISIKAIKYSRLDDDS